ncbi:MAG TPA: hypothetical protein VK166_01860 [Chitinophagaceae bacterium]|nr:hypothetical protein [Chitinophagaceae bacterium]
MKKTGFIISMALLIIFTGCKDDVIKPEPKPAGPNTIRFAINSLPADDQPANAPIYAVVSIEDENNAEVVSNKKLAVSFSSKYITEKIELEDGAYRVTKFILVGENGLTRFATPKVNSEKASLVQKPLNLGLEVDDAVTLDQTVEVVKVAAVDKAESFGYPAGTFAQLNNDSYVKVKLQAIVTVGDINYDSIPAAFKITSWNAAGEKFEKDTLLSAGAKEVYLPSTHVRFRFQVNKWGVTDEMTLNRDQISEGTTYTIGGSKAAKKLKLEETFALISGIYKPDSKSIYSYNANGTLSKVEYYQKLPQYEDLQLVFKDLYFYDGYKVDKIDRFEGDGDKVGFTEFSYNAQGTKVTNIRQKSYDQETGAAIEYSYPPGQAQITIDYLYNNGNSMEYKFKIQGGNKVEDVAVSSRGGGESGKYKYDFNINPYAHMNMPTLYLSNLSRNNLIGQEKYYSGSIPTMEPSLFEYSYDNEGYPMQLIKSYKGYRSGDILLKTKTIYSY